MKHKQELQQYSVYNVTTNRIAQGKNTMFIGQPGVLEQVAYTPEAQSAAIKSYIYGTNDISLNYDGTNITRKQPDQLDGEKSQTIKFSITTDNNKQEYTIFTYTGIIQLTLFSQRILINRDQSSWYAWNNDKTKCQVMHNLNGYVDFITRYNCKEEIYISNTVTNSNTLVLHFGDFFKGDLVNLLKYFKVTESTPIALSSLVDFTLYNFSKDTIISIYRDSDTDQPSNIPGIQSGSIFQMSGKVADMKKSTFTYQKEQYYKLYAITPEQSRNDYVELIVWKLDESKNPMKQNVFSYEKYRGQDCMWQRYDNDQGYDLQIPYRFTFLGYTKKHNLPLAVTDATGEIFLQKAQSWADTKTITTDLCITKQFTFGLANKTMKVLTPNLNNKNDCEFILIYSSCWAESYFCNLLNPNASAGTWSTRKNMYNQQIRVLTLKHNLRGIVKIHIRDIRQDLYQTYVIDDSTIQIIFMKHYKYNKYEFFVDLYTIWKKDN